MEANVRNSVFFLCTTKRCMLGLFGIALMTVYIVSLGLTEMTREGHLKQHESPVGVDRPTPALSYESLRLSPPHKKLQVLLVTQGRTGSSFTSALISSSPRVFFMFEPLFPINKQIHLKQATLERIYGLLQASLTCDFMSVSADDLDLKIGARTETGKKFLRCERKKDLGFAHIQCLIDFVNACKSKDVSFVKTVRVPMRWVGPMLEKMNYLKILYLVRDPRAVLRSQSLSFDDNGFDGEVGVKNGAAANFCRDLTEDIREASKLATRFPGRLKVLRFENGATDPVNYTKEIYSFLGLDFTNGTMDYIAYLQHPTKAKNDFTVRRSDSKKIIDTWRTSTSGFKSAKIIDKYCEEVNSKLGYRKVTSEKMLKEIARPLFADPATFTKLRKKIESAK